jgi:hypothetical protein
VVGKHGPTGPYYAQATFDTANGDDGSIFTPAVYQFVDDALKMLLILVPWRWRFVLGGKIGRGWKGGVKVLEWG